ncbi:hypothetical protein, partial [Salmonella sp. s51933]|uniref:hypothetical protein n=1 Tax=Salmonella sp. s51933 TaxID=3160127 RepID=UPI0037541D46
KKQLFEEEQIKKSFDIEKATTKEFNVAIECMQKIYSDKKGAPVCSSFQNHVLDCYKENRHVSLKCSQLVHAYVDCVEQARMSLNEQK